MRYIKTFNNISEIIHRRLPKGSYTVSDSLDAYEAVLVRSADLHNETFPPSLLAIARAGAGVNNIPLERCSEEGIVVFNTPGANANAVCEMVLCSLLLSGRDVLGGLEWAKGLDGNIESSVEKGKNQFIGSELAGKTLGVVGLGSIGTLTANAAHKGLGMKVIGYDPYISVEAAWKLSSSVAHAKTLNEIFTKCDYITLHVPLTDQTRNMINAKTLGACKKDAVILNFSRGGLVMDSDILSALEEGTIRRYITDFPNETLLGKKGVLAVPHLGASTLESEENCAAMAASQLKLYLEEGTIVNSVNLPACEMPRGGDARLCIINRNVTNMVGQITAVLAAENLNIEDMINKSKGHWAYTLIDLSSKPHKEALEKIKAIDGVVRVRRL